MGLLMAGLDRRLSPTSVVTLTAWAIALSRLIVLSLLLPLDGCVAFQIALVCALLLARRVAWKMSEGI